MNGKNIILCALLLTAFGIAARLLPHLPNAAPIAAIALVAGTYLGRQWALPLPLAALLVSDLALGFYDWRIMLSVYGTYAAIAVMGMQGRKWQTGNFLGFPIAASTFFFLVTNGAVWAFSPWYEKSLRGLWHAYEMGLPFYRNMLLGDIAYTALLVGAFELAFLIHRKKVLPVGALRVLVLSRICRHAPAFAYSLTGSSFTKMSSQS